MLVVRQRPGSVVFRLVTPEVGDTSIPSEALLVNTCCGPGNVEAHEGVEVWSLGALEVRCRRADVEVFASRVPEVRCRRVDLEVQRYW